MAKPKFTDKEKKEIYQEWKSLINMSKKALLDWAKDKDRLKASLNRSEAGSIQSGYDSFHRIKRRKGVPMSKWDTEDFENAKQENGFNKRMLGNKPGDVVSGTDMSKWEISLRNWGHDPSLKSSPAYSKYQSWKKSNEEKIKESLKKGKRAGYNFYARDKMASMKKYVVFVDLDETLVKTQEGENREDSLEKLYRKKKDFEIKADTAETAMRKQLFKKVVNSIERKIESMQTGTTMHLDGKLYSIFKRPGIEDFFRKVSQFANVYVYSLGTKNYVDQVLNSLDLHPYVDGFFSAKENNYFRFVKNRPFVLVDDMTYGSSGVKSKLRAILKDNKKWEMDEKMHLHIKAFDGSADRELNSMAKKVRDRLEAVDSTSKIAKIVEQVKVAHQTKVAKNVPTDKKLWDRVIKLTKGEIKSLREGKKKVDGPRNGKGFKKFPTAYSNGWAAKTYKELGGGWKKEKKASHAFGASLERKYGVVVEMDDPDYGDAYEPHIVKIRAIHVPEEKQGLGLGTKVMDEIIAWADSEGHILTLTPSSDFGSKISRLKKFYKRFGFRPNKGRSKDFRSMDAFIRYPFGKRTARSKVAKGKAKKDVGHGGLDEWFSGHGGKDGEGEDARWGDWVSISPVKKEIEKEDGKKKTIEPGDIIGPCGISDKPEWKEITDNGKDPLKCMPRQKAYDMPKKERAELAKNKKEQEKNNPDSKSPVMTRTFKKKASQAWFSFLAEPQIKKSYNACVKKAKDARNV